MIFRYWYTCGSLETAGIHNNENNMVDKSKLSKDIEEQIQSLASDVYIQVEEKITNLIATAVSAQISQTTDQQNKALSEKEQSLQQGFSDKQQLQVKELAQLKQALAEKEADAEASKQNFQVELTQNTINYTETIERLGRELSNAKQRSNQQQDDQQTSDHKLEEKLLEIEQCLNDKTQAVDGLNGRIMVLTEQEQNLTQQLSQAKEQIQSVSSKQAEAINEVKQQITAAKEQQIAAIAAKLQQAENDVAQVKAEALQSNESKASALGQKITQLTEQIQQEQSATTELQQQLSALQKALDTEHDKNKSYVQAGQDYQDKITKLTEASKQTEQAHQAQIAKLNEQNEQQNQAQQTQHEQQSQAHQTQTVQLNEQAATDKAQQSQEHQAQIVQLHEQAASDKEQRLEEIKLMNVAAVEAKQLQAIATQKIIELDKANEQLSKQVATEQNDIALYQQEVVVLNEQVKVAQDGQENILQRFNKNRDKQEQENNKVRETIKFLRDENHELLSASGVQVTEYNDKISDLELRLTEYRLKFEYAQKQLTS